MLERRSRGGRWRGWIEEGVEEVGGALRVGGGGEEGGGVVGEHLEPGRDVGAVVLEVVDGEVELRAEEGGREFGGEFFQRVARVAVAGGGEVAIEARGRTRPVGEFVRARGEEAGRVDEGVAWRDVHGVGRRSVEGRVCWAEGGGDAGEGGGECGVVGVVLAVFRRGRVRGGREEGVGEAVDLVRVEDSVAAEDCAARRRGVVCAV